MKHIQTFLQHIDESQNSNLQPPDVKVVTHEDMPKTSEMTHFTEDEKDLLIRVCEMIGFEYRTSPKIYSFLISVNINNNSEPAKPYVFFKKRTNGVYSVDIDSSVDPPYERKKNGGLRIKPNPFSRDIFYETESLLSAIYVALGDIGEDIDVNWEKIK